MLLFRFILLIVTASMAATQPLRAENTKPNILFFLADDLGWKDLGTYGSTFYESPAIDQLAADGLKFTNAYTASTVCSPTRASIITGQTPARHGCTDYGGRIDPEAHTGIAKALQDGGYQTFFTGKWHIGGMTPTKAGFAVSGEISARGAPKDDPKSTGIITRNTLRFLRKADPKKPFFASAHYHAVHLPLRERGELVDKYKAKLASHPPKSHGPVGLEKERDRDNKQVQDIPEYGAMLEAVDTSVRQILDALKESGRDKNTIVVFYSDNGGLSTKPCTSNLPLRAGKGWPYEGGIRVPLIIRWPNVVQKGSTTDVPINSMDFYPTFLECAGLPLRPKEHVDGVSIRSLLTKESPPERETLFWHYPHYHGAGCTPVGALRDGDHKLIHWYGSGNFELYDLGNDTSELKNISADAPETLERLKQKLKAWQDSFSGLKYDNPSKFKK